jgi:hypothetical protein
MPFVALRNARRDRRHGGLRFPVPDHDRSAGENLYSIIQAMPRQFIAKGISMGNSTLDPENFENQQDRVLGRGHGTGALGPGDTSDSGSDVAGGTGMASDTGSEMPLEGSGNTSEPEHGAGAGAGPDLGDSFLESDTDSNGTGERAAAGRDTVAEDGADIGFDRVGSLDELDAPVEDEDVAAAQSELARGGKPAI